MSIRNDDRVEIKWLKNTRDQLKAEVERLTAKQDYKELFDGQKVVVEMLQAKVADLEGAIIKAKASIADVDGTMEAWLILSKSQKQQALAETVDD